MEGKSGINAFFEGLKENERDLFEGCLENEKIRSQVEKRILKQERDSERKTSLVSGENPFFKENLCMKNLEILPEEELLSSIKKIRSEIRKTPTGKDNCAAFAFYEKEYERLRALTEGNQITEKERHRQVSVLSRNLSGEMEKSLLERYLAWKVKVIDEERKKLVKELLPKLELLKKLKRLISPFSHFFGRFFDYSERMLDESGFELLEQYAELLEKDKGIEELAGALGRWQKECDRWEKELGEKVSVRTEFHPENAWRGQRKGLTLGNDLSSALPSELALFKSSSAKMYFLKKFAEKKILSYDYMNLAKVSVEEKLQEKVQKKERKGPVIICVDTSGSMHGAPEMIAKTVTFAVTKKCLEGNRKCYLISFSTKIQVQDLSRLEGADALRELVSFLQKSFYGGTDPVPALEHSLELLSENEWKDADVLLISDFVMSGFDEETRNRIEKQKKNHTRFHSLVIGKSGNCNGEQVFDGNWEYNPDSENAMNLLVKKFKKIS